MDFPTNRSSVLDVGRGRRVFHPVLIISLPAFNNTDDCKCNYIVMTTRKTRFIKSRKNERYLGTQTGLLEGGTELDFLALPDEDPRW